MPRGVRLFLLVVLASIFLLGPVETAGYLTSAFTTLMLFVAEVRRGAV